MPSLNRPCHQITVNLLKMPNLSLAICSLYLAWKYIQWSILHLAVFIKKNISVKTYVVSGLILPQWHISSNTCTCKGCSSDSLDTQFCLTGTLGLLSFFLRKFLQACSGSSQSFPIYQTLLIWVRVPKYLKNFKWTAVVQKWDLIICKIKGLEWKLLNYCENKNLVLDQKLTKVKSQAIVLKEF